MVISSTMSGTCARRKMPTVIEGKSLFGSEQRAEKILHWSQARIGGARLTISKETGISLEIVARESNPRVFIYFSPEKICRKVAGLPKNICLSFSEDGFDYLLQGEVLQLWGLSLSPSSPKLWTGEIKNFKTELLGMVEVSSAGNLFYSKEECMALPNKSAALAVFDGVKKRELSERSKEFLARDAILNVLLSK